MSETTSERQASRESAASTFREYVDRCLTLPGGSETEWRSIFVHRGRPLGAPWSCDNSIVTSKYTALTFVPRSLFEQFRRTANQYFLFISILMVLGTYTTLFYSPLTPFSTIAPLSFILGVTMAKEGVEDLKRHQSDEKVNATLACAVEDGKEETVRWKDLTPGMVVKVRGGEEIPADLALLVTSPEANAAYVETSNIDGETNLKIKKPCLSADIDASKATKMDFQVDFEPPCGRIHTFEGTLRLLDSSVNNRRQGEIPLDASNFVLRGSSLRNTKWALGVVVYAGADTRLARNSRKVPSKLSEIERVVNNMVYFILFSMVVVCSVSTVAYVAWNGQNKQDLWYLCYRYKQHGVPDLFSENCNEGAHYADGSIWFTFFILYNNFIPISLYVTIEVINYCQAFYVDNDLRMYDDDSKTPALARTSNMNADLGMIAHVFSDKTGTLTRNVMRFERCAVGGRVYGDSNAAPPFRLSALKQVVLTNQGAFTGDSGPSAAADFVMIMAVCHTVIPERGNGDDLDDDDRDDRDADLGEKDGEKKEPAAKGDVYDGGEEKDLGGGTKKGITYQAESPDEEALVKGAVDLGLTFLDRRDDVVEVQAAATGGRGGTTLRFKILATIPFDSTRKRMSVVAQLPDGSVRVMTKGADSVIFERAASDSSSSSSDPTPPTSSLSEQLDSFARDGLRTLVLAQRKISRAFYDDWALKWRAAETATGGDRAELLAAAAAEIERDLEVVGATAIEDRLQEGVPETIAELAKAGIKVWVLTGDKMETAINVGYSCRLLTPDMYLIRMPVENAAPGPKGDYGVPEQLAALEALVQSAAEAQLAAAAAAEGQGPGPTTETPMAAAAHGGGAHGGPPSHAGEAKLDVSTTGGSSLEADPKRTLPKPLLDPLQRDRADSFTAASETAASDVEAGRSRKMFASEHLALVIEGSTAVEAILGNPDLEDRLLSLASSCRAVVACRVSPAQKRLMVKIVKDAPKRAAERFGGLYSAARFAFERPITLAIGDGANDVGMIQEAQIGVGISGKEGRQAVNNSDFAIAQFRFLKPLLFSHGRRNYRRMSKVIVYSFFKNIVLTFVLFYFQADAGWSGTSFYNSWVYSGYNFFLGLLPFTMGFFDVDIRDATVDKFPRLYAAGLRRMDLNVVNTVYATAEAIAASLLIYYVVRENLARPRFVWHPHGKTADVWVFGTTVFVAMVASMAGRAILLVESWNGVVAVCVLGQAAMLVSFVLFMSQTSVDVDYDYFGVAYHTFGLGSFWLVAVALVPATVCTLQLLIHALHLEFFPNLNDVGKEIDHFGLAGAAPKDGTTPGGGQHLVDLLPLRLKRSVHYVVNHVFFGGDALDHTTLVTRETLRQIHQSMTPAESIAIGLQDDVASSYAFDAASSTYGAGAGSESPRGTPPSDNLSSV